MIKLLIGVTKWAGAGVLTVLIAWQASSGPVREDSEVIIHVGVPDVEIRIDDCSYSVDRPWVHPVSCELPPGVHLLTMTKAGVEIYREVFKIEGGRDRVLTAWDENGRLNEDSVTPSSVESHSNRSLGIVARSAAESQDPAAE